MKKQNPEKLQQARNLYFNTTLSQAQIAELIGVSQKTVSLYITQNNWKLLKKRGTQLPSVFIEQMNCELQQLNNLIAAKPDGQRFPTLQEAEIRRKIMYSLSTIKERQSAGTHIETFMNLLTFAARENRNDALIISNYVHEFLKVEYNVPNDPPQKRHDLAGEPLSINPLPDEDDEQELEQEEHNKSQQSNGIPINQNTQATLNAPTAQKKLRSPTNRSKKTRNRKINKTQNSNNDNNNNDTSHSHVSNNTSSLIFCDCPG